MTRVQAAMRARELRRRQEVKDHAAAVIFWTLTIGGTFWSAYGLAYWVIW